MRVSMDSVNRTDSTTSTVAAAPAGRRCTPLLISRIPRARSSWSTSEWSWGESNPRPLSDDCPRYDHSRGVWLTAATPPGRLGPRSRRRIFLRCQWSFPPSAFFQAVTPCFCCRAAVSWPRAPLLVTVSLFGLSYQAARANSPSAVLVLPPFKESEATLVARSSLRSQRRNRSAPDRCRLVSGDPARLAGDRGVRSSGSAQWIPWAEVDLRWRRTSSRSSGGSRGPRRARGRPRRCGRRRRRSAWSPRCRWPGSGPRWRRLRQGRRCHRRCRR